ncbi:MAG: lysophospholipid acyltransferase family protein [Gemmataceae bacterium]|nr:lysophospholipid acyltransferase family protein [Gemmataceae bacterium]MCI0738136.1 lysophospholipid acyltransferase family protein [Gemmataceae bacterium]
MKLRHPRLIALAAFCAAWLVRVWIGSVRIRVFSPDGRRHPVDVTQERFLYLFWHEVLLLPTTQRTKIKILISQHADGELIARACKHLGFGVVRGSTTRGGIAALLGLAHAVRTSHLLITPDGPRGPRRRLQAGAIMLASVTGVPIVPFGGACVSAWRAGSWDRMLLPYPWTTACAVAGRPIRVPPRLDREGIERYRRIVEDAMHRATEAAEHWAQTGQYPKAAYREDSGLRKSA